MTILVLLGLTVISSLTLAGDFHIHLSLPNNTMDWGDFLSDSGSIEPKEPNGEEPTSDLFTTGMYMRTEKVF